MSKVAKCPRCGAEMQQVHVGDRLQDRCQGCGYRVWVVRLENTRAVEPKYGDLVPADGLEEKA